MSRPDSPVVSANRPWSMAKMGSFTSHMIVPMVVIGLAGTAGMIRRLRANLLDELAKQYTVTAKAKGLPPGRALLSSRADSFRSNRIVEPFSQARA